MTKIFKNYIKLLSALYFNLQSLSLLRIKKKTQINGEDTRFLQWEGKWFFPNLSMYLTLQNPKRFFGGGGIMERISVSENMGENNMKKNI